MGWLSAPSPPPAPDYAGAAAAQGAANVETALTQGRINNPNVINPSGTQTVTWDGNQPTIRQTLSPQEQQIYDTNAALRQAMSGLGLQGSQALSSILGKNLDLSGLPSSPDANGTRESVINAMMTRSGKDIGDREQNRRAELIAAGIPVNSDAFGKEMDKFERARNDARSQAEIAGGSEAQRTFGMGTESRRNAMAELLASRQTPLNEITALMSGGQVNNPFSMPGYAQNTQVAPPPTFAGAQAQGAWDQNNYNQQVGNYNNMIGGLFRLGGSAIAGSDIRLKSNIKPLGKRGAYNWYEYDIEGRREQGVMAQEVLEIKPEAVLVMDNGYYAVDYARL